MPRGRKKADVPSSPKSSRAKKKVEIPVNYEAPNLSNDHPEKMSSKRQTSTRGRQEISVESKKKEVVTKTKTSGGAERKSNPAKIETPSLESDQSLVRKSSRSKKETEKFSQWKVKGNKSTEKEAGNDENSSQSKVRKSRKVDDELKEGKEEESNQSKDVGKTRKPRKVGSVQIEEKVPDETSVKGRKVLDTKVSPIKKNQKKRKLSAEIIEAALTDSSKKAKVSPVKNKTTVATMSENPDLLEMIFGYLDPTSVKIASRVSR